jgi:hypothetical protein
MNMAERVRCALDDIDAGKLLSALMHACAAIDGTASKLYPTETNNRNRFVETFDRYLWVIEPMLAAGVNLEDTTFKWISLVRRPSKFSEIIYEIFRCNLAHGTEIPSGFEILLRSGEDHRRIVYGQQRLEIPDTIIFALLAAAVFSTANAGQKIGADSWLSCGTMHFTIDDWWGREADARICFSTVKAIRLTMQF